MNMTNGQPDETLCETRTEEMPVRDDLKARYGNAPNVRNTKLEEAAHRLVTRLRAEFSEQGPGGLLLGDGDVSDLTDLCADVEDTIKLAQSAVMPVPKLLEVTGNVEEKELAARYMEQKQKGALHYAGLIPSERDKFEHVAETFRAAAADLRAGLHLPEIVIEGRVIPYNELNDTGMRRESPLRQFFTDVHARNVKAGWWSDITNGEPKKRNVGELLILFVTEIAEAYIAWFDNAADDKLKQYPGIGVEMADLGIRWADFCGALAAGSILLPDPKVRNPGDEIFREIVDLAMRYDAMRKTPEAVGEPEQADFLPAMDVAAMIDAKLDFNAHRPDHKIENRLKEDGKRT